MTLPFARMRNSIVLGRCLIFSNYSVIGGSIVTRILPRQHRHTFWIGLTKSLPALGFCLKFCNDAVKGNSCEFSGFVTIFHESIF